MEISERNKIANTREVDTELIWRITISIRLLPLAIVIILSITSVKVRVLTPPALELGEPPIHIRNMII